MGIREAISRGLDITRWLRAPRPIKEAAKVAIGVTLELSGLNRALHELQVAALSPFVRAVSYHDVPPSQAGCFERQLLFLRERFTPIDFNQLLEFQAGRLRLAKPGLIVSFDDGLRSQAQVAAPLLEKHGITGWFFVPIAFVDTPAEGHAAYGQAHRIGWSRAPGDDLGAMSWDDVRRLDERHVVGCHTHTHVRLSADLGPERLREEIAGSKARLERELGHEVASFCWVGGEESSYSTEAAAAVREAGYRVAFMNAKSVIRPGTDLLQLHRVALEAPQPLWYVGYRLSGFLDVAYSAHRRRVNRLTACAGVEAAR